MNITVLGGGAWGTAMAQLLALNKHVVKLWCLERSVVDSIKTTRMNEIYLPGIELQKNISATSSIKEALGESEIVFCAVPVKFMRTILEKVKSHIRPSHKFVILSKGIEVETGMFPSEITISVLEVILEVIGEVKFAVLSGPNIAHEVAQKRRSVSIIASTNDSLTQEIKGLCESDFFCVKTSSDVIGVQACGALKNVMAICLGIACGANVNENFFAFIFTRALEEMRVFTKSVGGDPATAYGLAGIGDLLLSIEGRRNYNLGLRLGRGEKVEIEEMMPEGVNTTKAVHDLACKNNISLPICNGVYKVLYEKSSIPSFLQSLFNDSIDC